MDTFSKRLWIIRGHGNTCFCLLNWVIARPSGKNGGPSGCEIIACLIQTDSVPQEGHIPQAHDVGVRVTHHPYYVILWYQSWKLNITQFQSQRESLKSFLIRPPTYQHKLDFIPPSILQDPGGSQDVSHVHKADEASEIHHDKAISNDTVIRLQAFISREFR